MCYRYSNNVKVNDGLINKYKLRLSDRIKAVKAFEEKYHFYHTNAFAFQKLPVITMDKPDEIQLFQWGLIPSWAKDLKTAQDMQKLTPNATCEGVFEKPSYKGSIMTKRCLVPATGFFEWRDINKVKYPYHIMVKDEKLEDTVRAFCFGGLYSVWADKANGGEVHETFTIVTTPANPLMETIHNTKKRMPLILSEADEEAWLTKELSKEQITSLMKPYPTSQMVAHTISKRITSRDADPNAPEVLEPATYEGLDAWYETKEC